MARCPAGASPTNLPADLAGFVGRRRELAQVKQLLSASRLVTLTGVGGVGKSRLAVQAAAGMWRAFPDGVWLVDLSELRDSGLLAQTVASTFDLRDRSPRPPVVALTEYLADRRLLLVLDNCEHLLAACAREPSVCRARALLLGSQLAVVQGDFDSGRSLLAEGKALAQRLGDADSLGRLGYATGHLALWAGDVPAAIMAYEQALAAGPPDLSMAAGRPAAGDRSATPEPAAQGWRR